MEPSCRFYIDFNILSGSDADEIIPNFQIYELFWKNDSSLYGGYFYNTEYEIARIPYTLGYTIINQKLSERDYNCVFEENRVFL